MGADSSNGGGSRSRSGDSVGGLAIVVRTETWGTEDRRTDGRRRTLPTSNVQRTDSGQLGGVDKRSLGRGRPGQDGDGRGQGQVGRRFPFSLFISLSLTLSPVPCRALKPPIRWRRGPGRAGWCCWLAGGGRPAWRRSRQWYSGWGVGRLALVRGRTPTPPTLRFLVSRGDLRKRNDTPQGHPGTVPRWSRARQPEGSQGQFRARQQEGEKDGKEVHREREPRDGGKVGVNGKWARQWGKERAREGNGRMGSCVSDPAKGKMGNGK